MRKRRRASIRGALREDRSESGDAHAHCYPCATLLSGVRSKLFWSHETEISKTHDEQLSHSIIYTFRWTSDTFSRISDYRLHTWCEFKRYIMWKRRQRGSIRHTARGRVKNDDAHARCLLPARFFIFRKIYRIHR